MKTSEVLISEFAEFLSDNPPYMLDIQEAIEELEEREVTETNKLAVYALCNMHMEPFKRIVIAFLTNCS